MEQDHPRVVVVCGGRGGVKIQARLNRLIAQLGMVLCSDEPQDHDITIRSQELYKLDCGVIDPQFHRPATRKGKHKSKKAWDSPYGV